MSTISLEISPKKFHCTACSVSCDKNTEWIRHINTIKHKINETGENVNSLTTKYTCKCGKNYKERSGLWRHSKKCLYSTITDTDVATCTNNNSVPINSIISDNEEFKKLILEVVKNNTELQKQNQELQLKMLEVCQTNTVINNNNHSNNKTFNLNFFLNEQCKDAMNIMDFVDTFKLDFADLDSVGKLGYVEGISNIIIQKLNEMDIYKRPIHCSDLKRETTHVKDRGVWEKDNGNHDKLRLAIRHITQKNIRLLNPWIEAHPQAQASAHYLNDVYMNYVKQSMGGKGDLDDNESKIIRKIAKVVLIDK